MLELKKTEEWAFFFLFIGGALLLVNAILGSIIYSYTGYIMPFLDGFGFLTFRAIMNPGTRWLHFGSALNIVVGILALITGLKLFIAPIRNFITKIDVALVGLIMFVFGFGTFTLSGYFLIVGGIYCFLYRLSIEGANNKTAK